MLRVALTTCLLALAAAAAAAATPDAVTPDGGRYYGPLKTFSENLVKETYPNTLIIRPGLIVGPLDPSDRFTYWPVRID